MILVWREQSYFFLHPGAHRHRYSFDRNWYCVTKERLVYMYRKEAIIHWFKFYCAVIYTLLFQLTKSNTSSRVFVKVPGPPARVVGKKSHFLRIFGYILSPLREIQISNFSNNKTPTLLLNFEVTCVWLGLILI